MRISKLVPFICLGSAYALPALTLPWFGQLPLEGLVKYWDYFHGLDEERTIYQVLKDDKKFSRLVKAIDLSDRVVELLDDSSKNITFFAVPNSALKRPHKPRKDDERPAPSSMGDSRDIAHDLTHLVLQAEELDLQPDSPDKEHRKEALGRILRGILAYHILPKWHDSFSLIENSTFATNLTLKDGSMDYEPLRLSVQSTTVPPRLRINTFVEVTKRDIEAKNGIIHQISHPLLPPPSIFQEAFLVPEVFSYVTSAIQRVGLTGAIDRWHAPGEDGEKGGFYGATSTTFFAPTSGAFQRLPKKLRLFLFSSFGEGALKKLLEFHIVPNFVLHSGDQRHSFMCADYYHNATSEGSDLASFYDDLQHAQMHSGKPGAFFFTEDDDTGVDLDKNPPPPLPKPVYEYNITLPTLLENHTLHVHVARYKSKIPVPGPARFFTRFKVNGREVGSFDIPARNGALHVIGILLNPRKRYHRHDGHDDHHEHSKGYDDSWNDWEEWLPQWAMEN
ncbi:FAS1 domain-containing protein [Phlebopus sp. FC_14]|nr:FAS1 domain-containing protein [Phlebopus sp. FC_14]